MKNTDCIICGSNEKVTLANQNFKDKYLELLNPKYNKTTRKWVNCEICGFIYHDPLLDKTDTKNLYDKFRDISFRNEDLDKDYPIYIGNDTLAKLEWGAPLAEGCEYKRLYKVEANNSFLINQSVLTEQREVNITRNFIGEVKIISA